VLRAPHGAICAILVLATDVSRYKLTEQLVRWIASRLDAGDDSSTFAVVTGRYRPYEDLVGEAAENVGLPRELANELASRYAELNPWPEVKDVLRTLHNAGVPVGVVTNCSETLGRIAANCVGIPFTVFATAERAGYYKPQP
jgi:phosphoglycolate phosphatase-like HAD superfamily hydrolase